MSPAATSTATLDQAAARRRPRSRDRANPLDFTRKGWVRAALIVNFVFLYFPILALIAFSFNDSKRNITWQGFTLEYYEKAFTNNSLHEAFINSMIVALVSTVVSTVIGTLLGVALYRYRFPGKGPFEGLVHLPIVIPEVCMAVAMVAFFAVIADPINELIRWLCVSTPVCLPEFGLSLTTVTISHIAFSFPFVAVVVRARMIGFDESLEEASRDLGATKAQTFWNVTLPYLMPGVISGALLAFTLSLDDFVITFFTSGPGSTTFPIKIYSMVRFSVTPEVNAASTVLIVLTLTLTLLAMWVQRRTGQRTLG